MCLFPTPCAVTPPWKFDIGCGGSIYAMEIGKGCKLRLFFLGELVVKH